MNTHTPGPWNTAPEFPDQVYSVPEYERAKRDNPEANPYDESLICETADNIPNARLIASAPELLDVLALALPYVETAESDPAYKPGAVKRMVAKMRDAITKAEGKA